MRFAYVLLGLVRLASLQLSSATNADVVFNHPNRGPGHPKGLAGYAKDQRSCSNGLRGVEADNICCEELCGTCGGPGCSNRPGGQDACCTSNIEESGAACDTTREAPCIINVCSDGVPGVQDDNICCLAECGTCGGAGCGDRPGGGVACCTSNIEDSGTSCTISKQAPCIIDLCSNGVPGVEDGNICCEAECGTCGGSGCGGRPGGEDACCTSNIEDSGVACDTTGEAPCIINGNHADVFFNHANRGPGHPKDLTGYPKDVLSCSNGLPGVEADNVCCEERCGTCGGPGCSSRPGGQDACCTGNIEESGAACDTTGEAPCIINVCSNGVPGVEDDNICCEVQCGTCGGGGCSDRPGGEDACCSNDIEDNGVMCSTTFEAPCIEDLCSNGVPGVQSNDICCATQCGSCGGPGCSSRSGGQDACCADNIRDDGPVCSATSKAPCIIDAVMEQT